MTDRIVICETCAGPGEEPQGAAFATALRARLGADARVETVACLNHCGAPVAVALRAEGKAVYLFAGVDPARDLEDAVALARLYADAADGEITDARPAGRLRHCLIGKVPA